MITSGIRNFAPNTAVKSVPVNARTSNFQTTRSGEVIAQGTPIGLLLALTYAQNVSAIAFYGDFRPNVLIR